MMGARDFAAEALARQAIDALNARFAYQIDNGQSAQVPELFTVDGHYAIAHGAERRVSTGQAAIRAAYEERAARGARTSCHLFTNLHVSGATTDTAHSHCFLLLFAQDGLPPHPAQPLLVARYDDICERDAQGLWRYRSREATVLFVSDDHRPIALPLAKA
ncbi:nuclear transport factor 2 family protein [Hydrogenophaga sp. BPS33]|uniref:nuclear transport factor 2 family protein n=1 Tax=Hydrogenophaga sp. BPS33 TaxID=2651974 RepID=UPI0013201694|nr:nuclear transport factor 2 family protein [Hydrogenophaga sp. BPS33]QHE85980.1 nuclear transport factor 2 family protein [Hydrogenophaga sp. BPS33]